MTFKEFSKRGMYIFSPQLGLTDFFLRGFPRGSAGKESTCNAGDLSSVPGSGRYPGEGNAESTYRTIDRDEILWGRCPSGVFILGREIRSKFDQISPEI